LPNDIQAFLNIPIEKQDVKNLILRNYLMTESKITPFTRKEDKETWELWNEWEETLVKLKKLSEENKFIYMFPEDDHPTKEGNSLAAKILAEEMQTLLSKN